MRDSIRGKKERPSKLQYEFYKKFPQLLCDDPEDEHNELIRILRNTAFNYFKKLDGEKK